MKLYVENKMVSLRGSSYVLDERGDKVYEVRGKLVSPTHKKFLYDQNGTHLFTVRNKYWHFFMRTAILKDERGVEPNYSCRIKEKFFGLKFAKTQVNLRLEGKLFKPIAIYEDEVQIGAFKRTSGFIDFMPDGYEVEVFDEEKAAFLVACVIAFDNLSDARDRDTR